MSKFLVTLGIVTLLILAVGLAWFSTLPSYFYQTLIFLFVSTAGLFYFLLKTKSERPDFFVQLYLLTITGKLIVYGAYVLIVVANDRSGAVPNAIFFLGVYLTFTALEIGFLYHRVNS